MSKFNLKNDIIFTAFFARKGNEEFLIDFLQSILKIEINKMILFNKNMIKIFVVDISVNPITNEKTINMINVFIKLSLLFDTKKEKEKLKIIFSNINIIFSILSSS